MTTTNVVTTTSSSNRPPQLWVQYAPPRHHIDFSTERLRNQGRPPHTCDHHRLPLFRHLNVFDFRFHSFSSSALALFATTFDLQSNQLLRSLPLVENQSSIISAGTLRQLLNLSLSPPHTPRAPLATTIDTTQLRLHCRLTTSTSHESPLVLNHRLRFFIVVTCELSRLSSRPSVNPIGVDKHTTQSYATDNTRPS